MEIISDVFGRKIRFTDERKFHILRRVEMKGQENKMRRNDMEKRMSVWFDREGDFMEFGIDTKKKGFFRDLGNDVFERVDAAGNVLGFAVFNFTKRSFVEEKIKLPVKMKMVQAQ